jgi:hypothetical protein
MAKKAQKVQFEVRNPEADVAVEETSGPIEGVLLPEDMHNPKPGEDGHYCMDPHGRYQPTWSAVYIHKGSSAPTAQSFLSETGKSLRVKTGMWVDVPKNVVRTLRETTYDDVESTLISEDGGLSVQREQIIKTTPRFQYSSIPSA